VVFERRVLLLYDYSFALRCKDVAEEDWKSDLCCWAALSVIVAISMESAE
jgi:hypothetical protein